MSEPSEQTKVLMEQRPADGSRWLDLEKCIAVSRQADETAGLRAEQKRTADAAERIAAALEKDRFDPNCDRCGETLASHRCEP